MNQSLQFSAFWILKNLNPFLQNKCIFSVFSHSQLNRRQMAQCLKPCLCTQQAWLFGQPFCLTVRRPHKMWGDSSDFFYSWFLNAPDITFWTHWVCPSLSDIAFSWKTVVLWQGQWGAFSYNWVYEYPKPISVQNPRDEFKALPVYIVEQFCALWTPPGWSSVL